MEEKTKFSKILPNNQIITACRVELRVHEITMNEKLTMTGLTIIKEFIILFLPCLWEQGAPWQFLK